MVVMIAKSRRALRISSPTKCYFFHCLISFAKNRELGSYSLRSTSPKKISFISFYDNSLKWLLIKWLLLKLIQTPISLALVLKPRQANDAFWLVELQKKLEKYIRDLRKKKKRTLNSDCTKQILSKNIDLSDSFLQGHPTRIQFKTT